MKKHQKKDEGRHFSFFNHRKCEYFPCHETEDPDNFNCLFCYCPLYALGPDCGGNFQYRETGIKDCTKCLLPHRRENYTLVTGRFQDIVTRMSDMYKTKDPEKPNSFYK